jgi:patatin-like phospholipase/acyl hydrolase
MPAYHILSLDGGGIRGIFSARVLERLELAVPGFLGQLDLLTGTSTGGIIALGLAAGMTPAQLVRLYRDEGPQIFDDSWLDNLRDLGNLSGAKYDNANLKEILTREFAARAVSTLDDLARRVLVPTFDLDDGQDPRRKLDKPRSWKPKFFHNYPGPDSDGAELIVDVAMRTTAAPTYFPTYGRFIDGGVVANDPSVSALAQALNDQTGGQDLRSVRLLSIGTGINPTYIAGADHDWGYTQWAKPIIGLMMEGVMGVAAYECAQLLGDRYHRVNCVLDQPIPLDAYSKVDSLIGYADALDLTDSVAWIQRYVMAPAAAALKASRSRKAKATTF